MNVAYRHEPTGRTVTYSAPVPGLESSKLWRRVEGPAYGRMKKPELVELCTQRGVDADGTIPVLAERLAAYDVEHRNDPPSANPPAVDVV